MAPEKKKLERFSLVFFVSCWRGVYVNLFRSLKPLKCTQFWHPTDEQLLLLDNYLRSVPFELFSQWRSQGNLTHCLFINKN